MMANRRRILSEIANGLKAEARYALSDIRQSHEQLWFGQPQTPSHWQDSLSHTGATNRQAERFEQLYGRREPNQQQPTSDHAQSVIHGIGTQGDERSNWDAAKQTAQAYHAEKLDQGSPLYPGSENALVQQQSAFERYYGDNAEPPDDSVSDIQTVQQEVHAEDLGSDLQMPAFTREDLYGSDADFQQARFEEVYGRLSDDQLAQEIDRQSHDQELEIDH